MSRHNTMTVEMNTVRKCLMIACLAVLSTGCPSTPVVDGTGEGTGDNIIENVEVEASADAVDAFMSAVEEYNSTDANYGRVAAYLEDAVEQDPSFARAWFNLGVAREELDDQAGAIEAYQQSHAADPAFVDGIANIGAIHLRDGDEDEAERFFRQAVETEQFHPGANLNLAYIHRDRSHGSDGYIDNNEADQAINHIRLALAGDATNAAAYEVMAAVYYDLESFTLARLVCVNAMALDIHSAPLHNRLGLILLAEDDVTGAFGEFRQAIGLDESFVEASMNLGAVALSYRDYEGALEAFDRVAQYETENVQALLSRSVAMRGISNYDGAAAGYQQVLQIAECNLPALFNLGVLFQEYHVNYQGALEWFQEYEQCDRTRSSDLAENVSTRIGLLEELIELVGPQGAQPEPLGPPPGELAPFDDAPADEPPADDGPVDDGGADRDPNSP